jgi:hypothetical protein
MTGAVATYLCASFLLLTAAVHSVLGERRLLIPLLRQRDGVLQSELARFLLRAVWHFMSVGFAIISTGLIASVGSQSSAGTALLAATAIGIGGAGVYDAIGSRGQHIGWPLLVLIGILALIALLADS